MHAYINSVSKYLPGDPVDNDSMEEFLGAIHGKPSRVRRKILRQNGIQTRHYAIDREQNTLVRGACWKRFSIYAKLRQHRKAHLTPKLVPSLIALLTVKSETSSGCQKI